jgi:uncharacterized membrane protein YraQ (UPF0718 family)
MWYELSRRFIYDAAGLEGRLADAVHFFLYDTVKIWFLLISIIFAVSFLRTWFNTEMVRAYLA